MPLIVVISGPIGAGKSTVAAGLTSRLRGGGRIVASIDLDAVVDMIGGFVGLAPETLGAARDVHGRLVAAWFDRGADVVVHGPFPTVESEAPLLRELPPGVQPRRVRLLVSYDAALERVTTDESPRNLSRNPVFLRTAFARYEATVPRQPPADWTFDTESISAAEIVDVLEAALRVESA